jgi:precorrin-2 dehydrogenase/sirohydrochlorin ferrochelatase
MLDLSDRLVVIVGGGAVAARKARGLLEAGATRVRAVSPTFSAEMPAQIERVEHEYDPRWIDGATLVFAATDNAGVNDQIVRDARRLGILVNRADSHEDNPGDFATPAVHRDGELILTMSANSPALSAAIRDRLAEHCDPKWTKMAAAMCELRPRIVAGGAPIEYRRNAFRDLASDEAMEILDRDGLEQLWAWLRERNKGI